MVDVAHADIHPSALGAVNEALAVLGQDIVLTAATFKVDAADAHGRKAAFLYESSRMRVLRDHAWSFARREADAGGGCGGECAPPCPHGRPPRRGRGGLFRDYLPWERRAAGDPSMPFRTPVPGRCARVTSCLGPDGREVSWRISGREIRSALPVARVSFTYDERDLAKWSPDAYRALVLRLAADLAKPITGRINERQLQEEAYRDQIEAAKASDAREGNQPRDAWEA